MKTDTLTGIWEHGISYGLQGDSIVKSILVLAAMLFIPGIIFWGIFQLAKWNLAQLVRRRAVRKDVEIGGDEHVSHLKRKIF